MSQRAIARARRRRSADYAIDWTMAPPTREFASVISGDFDDCRYDDVLRPALRLKGTLRLGGDGEPDSLTDLVADRPADRGGTF
jgi:hypothetical protein